MHDFDRIQAEYEPLISELGAYQHEFPGEGELSGEWEGEGEPERCFRPRRPVPRRWE